MVHATQCTQDKLALLEFLVFGPLIPHEKLAHMSIHEEIARRRQKLGWSHQDLADRVSEIEGLTKKLAWQTVQQWETNTAPKRSRMAHVAEALGTTVPALLGMDLDQSAVVENEVMRDELSIPGHSVLVPVLSVSASMGAGIEQQHDEVVVGRLSLSPQWINRRIPSVRDVSKLRFIHGYGDSMEPTFNDGDVLLVDSGVHDIGKVDGVYVLEANERLYIKRVRRRMNGEYEISSDNPTVKTVDVLDGSKPVTVLGRVVHLWIGKTL